jgi:hypothetical protein
VHPTLLSAAARLRRAWHQLLQLPTRPLVLAAPAQQQRPLLLLPVPLPLHSVGPLPRQQHQPPLVLQLSALEQRSPRAAPRRRRLLSVQLAALLRLLPRQHLHSALVGPSNSLQLRRHLVPPHLALHSSSLQQQLSQRVDSPLASSRQRRRQPLGQRRRCLVRPLELHQSLASSNQPLVRLRPVRCRRLARHQRRALPAAGLAWGRTRAPAAGGVAWPSAGPAASDMISLPVIGLPAHYCLLSTTFCNEHAPFMSKEHRC